MMTKIENRNPKKSSSIFWGSSVSTAVFVEITPLILSKSQPPPSCSNFTCKHILQKVTLQSCMSTTKVQEDKTLIEWKNESTENCSENFNNGLSCGYLVQRNTTTDENRATFSDVTESFPIYYLPADDSSVLDLQPYCIVVYGNRRDPSTLVNEVIVTPASLMRVLPPRVVVSSYPRRSHKYQDWNKRPNIIISRPQWSIQEDFLQKLSAELGDDFLSDDLEAEVIRNHNPETVRELTLRFSLLLSQLVNIGTTSDAFSLNNQWISQSFQFDHAIQSFCEAKGIPLRIQKQHDLNQQSKRGTHQSQSNGLTSLQWEPSLLIHSPNHADGKTLLAQAIAKRAGCASVHIVRPGALLAKYGIHADAALESLLHSIIISAAVKNKSLCIILDHLDTMMPARLSGRGSDTAAPIFNAIGKYDKTIPRLISRDCGPLTKHSSFLYFSFISE